MANEVRRALSASSSCSSSRVSWADKWVIRPAMVALLASIAAICSLADASAAVAPPASALNVRRDFRVLKLSAPKPRRFLLLASLGWKRTSSQDKAEAF